MIRLFPRRGPRFTRSRPLLWGLLLCCLLFAPQGALGQNEEPPPARKPPFTQDCRLSADVKRANFAALFDGEHQTYLVMEQGNTLTLEWAEGAAPAFLRVEWNTLGKGFTLTQRTGAGEETLAYSCTGRDRTSLFPLGGGAVRVTIAVDAVSRLAELEAYGEDDPLPEDLQPFLPPHQKADLLVVSAHPDDEIVMFGGLLPLYAGERGYAAQVLYMTMQNKIRYGEARAGLWAMGVRHAPQVASFEDAEGQSADRYYRIWGGKDAIVGYLVEQIRLFQPLVVVTHDLKGEYGHGAHMVTADCVRLAVEAAADPERYPGSAELHGPWQVQKLYLHLYAQNGIDLPYDQPLAAFDGRTALDVAAAAYACHASQRQAWLNHLLRGTYDSARYGLAFTAVGPDSRGDDLFEHVDLSLLAGKVE